MSINLVKQAGVRIAIEGCGHGTLHSIYASIKKSCEFKGWDGIDLLIIGGDFQAVRNAHDLNCMSVPFKYREMGDFWQYYAGKRTAPYLTLFIAGNHEAANHLFELYYGGWVAPNIYYMGAANVLRFGPLRIAGLSGIWKGHDYRKPHHERLPYNNDDVKSAYHVREFDTRKLLQLRTQVDVGLSHDWPQGIEWKGDYDRLFRIKQDFRADATSGRLGSQAAKQVLNRLRPPHWFSAHLHVKYTAIVNHEETTSHPPQGQLSGNPTPLDKSQHIKNTDEIDLDMDDTMELAPGPPSSNGQLIQSSQPKNDAEIDLDLDALDSAVAGDPQQSKPDDAATKPTDTVSQELRSLLPASFTRPTEAPQLPFPTGITNKTTEFLSLDKCLPNRDFLQLLDITPLSDDPIQRPLKLEYDQEWLAITRVFASDLVVGNPSAVVPPDKGEAVYLPLIQKEEAWVEENVLRAGKSLVPENFEITAPPYDGQSEWRKVTEQPREYSNNQTRTFCNLLQIPNPFHAEEDEIQQRIQQGPRPDTPRGGRGGRGSRFGGRGGGNRGGRGGGGYSRGGWGRGGRGGGGGHGANSEPLGGSQRW